jgi:hypothetical protein
MTGATDHPSLIDKYAFRPSPSVASSSATDTSIDPLINWPTWYGVLQTASFDMTVDGFGRFGYHPDYEFGTILGWPFTGFIAPPGTNIGYLYAGVLLVGGISGQDTLVNMGYALTYTGGPEMYPPNFRGASNVGPFTGIAGPADFCMRNLSIDTYHPRLHDDWFYKPLGLRIVTRSYVWRSERTEDIAVFDIIITNVSDGLIRRGAVGIHCDADITYWQKYSYGAYDDFSGSIPAHGIAYAIDNDGDPLDEELPDTLSPRRAIGIKFLDASFEIQESTFNWWLPYWQEDFGPRMHGTSEYPFRDLGYNYDGWPADDADVYYMMTKPEWDYDQCHTGLIRPDDSLWLYPPQTKVAGIIDGADTRFLLSISPFDLLPDSSIRVLYAAFVPDSVIYRTDLKAIMKYIPELYTDALDLDRLIEEGEVADSLAAILLDPMNPVVGVELVHSDADSVVVQWDPWVFPTIDGYEVFVTEVKSNEMPHPGVVPPWHESKVPTSYSSVDGKPRTVITGLDPTAQYCLQVAHRVGGELGQLSEPVVLSTESRTPNPEFESNHVFVPDGADLILRWDISDEADVHHFNLYCFEDSLSTRSAHRPFYDLGFARDSLEPDEVYDIEGTTYYYYAMQPYRVLHAQINEIVEVDVSDRATYVVSVVDSLGNESALSEPCIVRRIPPMARDLLLLTYSGQTDNFVEFDTIKTFYDSIMRGYSYDLYHFKDSMSLPYCSDLSPECVNWLDFTRYRMVIIDDGLRDEVPNYWWEDNTSGLSNYLASGGTVVWFGAASSFAYLGMGSANDWVDVNYDLIATHFGLDSIHYAGLGYFLTYEDPPYVDTLFGFSHAEAVGHSVPRVSFDTTRWPFTPQVDYFWPEGTPPVVATFAVGDSSRVTHYYRSKNPDKSSMEGEPVGIVTDWNGIRTRMFGFHLWYMDHDEARNLIDWIMEPIDKPCCAGYTGNIDGSPHEQPDIADLTLLIDHLYLTGNPLPCPAEANLDGDANGDVDIFDLVVLIDHLFMSRQPTGTCH